MASNLSLSPLEYARTAVDFKTMHEYANQVPDADREITTTKIRDAETTVANDAAATTNTTNSQLSPSEIEAKVDATMANVHATMAPVVSELTIWEKSLAAGDKAVSETKSKAVLETKSFRDTIRKGLDRLTNIVRSLVEWVPGGGAGLSATLAVANSAFEMIYDHALQEEAIKAVVALGAVLYFAIRWVYNLIASKLTRAVSVEAPKSEMPISIPGAPPAPVEQKKEVAKKGVVVPASSSQPS